VPPKSQKPAVVRPAAATNLPALMSEAPKLQHMCSQRPRRTKNKPVTRPTVGLTKTEDVIDEEGSDDVDVFFMPSTAKPVAGASSNFSVVNGELDKG